MRQFEEGKNRSRQNALKHGIVASALLITTGEGAEDPADWADWELWLDELPT